MFGLRDHLRQIVKYFKSGPWETSSLNTRIVYFTVRNGVRSCMRLTFAFPVSGSLLPAAGSLPILHCGDNPRSSDPLKFCIHIFCHICF